jgi:predicted Fe-Mo cluster-binding NifX family protein
MVIILRIAVPTKNTRGLDGEVAEVFSRAPFFTLIDTLDSEPKSIDVIDNTASSYSHGAGPIAVKILHDNGVDLLFAPEIGIGTSTLLEEMKIRYKKVEKNAKVSTLLVDLT